MSNARDILEAEVGPRAFLRKLAEPDPEYSAKGAKRILQPYAGRDDAHIMDLFSVPGYTGSLSIRDNGQVVSFECLIQSDPGGPNAEWVYGFQASTRSDRGLVLRMIDALQSATKEASAGRPVFTKKTLVDIADRYDAALKSVLPASARKRRWRNVAGEGIHAEVVEGDAKAFIKGLRPPLDAWLKPMGFHKEPDGTWVMLYAWGRHDTSPKLRWVEIGVTVRGEPLRFYEINAWLKEPITVHGTKPQARVTALSFNKMFHVHADRINDENAKNILGPFLETLKKSATRFAYGPMRMPELKEIWREMFQDVVLVWEQEWAEQAALHPGAPEPDEV